MLSVIKEIVLFYVEIALYMVLGLAFVALLHKFVSKDLTARHMGNNNMLSDIMGPFSVFPCLYVSTVSGVSGVEVSLERKETLVSGDADMEAVKKAIRDSGYTVE